jgi:hypothetical protein
MPRQSWQLALILIALVTAQSWDDNNDPSIFAEKYQRQFSQLPLYHQLPNTSTPWSDIYWPSAEGGLTRRWYEPNYDEPLFNYTLNTKEQLEQMSHQEKQHLSPAEKFDILHGRYDYPTVASERLRTSPDDPGWEGMCHGWAPAAIHYKQPKPINVTNSDGIVVPFGSSDIKGLLTYFIAEFEPIGVEYAFIGQRCESFFGQYTKEDVPDECTDLNAGSFHILIANEIGLKDTSFVADIDPWLPVWNQPVAGYEARIVETVVLNKTEKNGAVREHSIINYVSYVRETNPEFELSDPKFAKRLFKYWLQVDAKDNIVGGRYESEDYFDFAWRLVPGPFSGYFDIMKQLLGESDSNDDDSSSISLPTFRDDNHVVLDQVEGIIEESVTKEKLVKVWKIHVEKASAIIFKFSQLNTKRFMDRIRIYESEDGPLIANIHGDVIPPEIKVVSSNAYIVFSSQGKKPASFKLNYAAV